jgi:hypothetical protein
VAQASCLRLKLLKGRPEACTTYENGRRAMFYGGSLST